MNVVELAEAAKRKLQEEILAKSIWNAATPVTAHFDQVPLIIHTNLLHWIDYMMRNSMPWERYETDEAYWIFKDGCLHKFPKESPETVEEHLPQGAV